MYIVSGRAVGLALRTSDAATSVEVRSFVLGRDVHRLSGVNYWKLGFFFQATVLLFSHTGGLER